MCGQGNVLAFKQPEAVFRGQVQAVQEKWRISRLNSPYRDIRSHIAEIYGMFLSNGTLNAITDKLIPELQVWRERDLEAIYPIVWLDAIHYKIKEHGRHVSKVIYTILGMNIEGKKELLGLYLSDREGAHHWLSVLTDLHNRFVLVSFGLLLYYQKIIQENYYILRLY